MATVSVSPTSPKVDQVATVTLSGASNNTTYVLRISHPGGATETHTITTNGSGTAAQTYVPQESGTATFNVDPIPAASGSTATTTATHGH